MRHLLCGACGERYPIPGDDLLIYPASAIEPAEYGRVTKGRAATPRPEQRVMHVNAEPFPLEPGQYNCDDCNATIEPGDPVTCVTVWRADRPKPPAWEGAYLNGQNS